MKFEKEAIKDGQTCPFCGEVECIESDSIAEFDGNSCFLDVVCIKCEKEWREKYKLNKVVPR